MKVANIIEENLIKSKKRINDHGEVFTAKREVNAMLDLVKRETERIGSRFLEPACGTGNFMTEILKRKISIIEKRYKKSQLEYERYSILAVGSIYGIDLLEDNIESARERLFKVFQENYERLFKNNCKKECSNSIKFILSKNIIVGDALTLKTVGKKSKPIIFTEWSLVNGSMIKKRDFSFKQLLVKSSSNASLFFSDLGRSVFIPTPIKEYPVIHFMKIGE